MQKYSLLLLLSAVFMFSCEEEYRPQSEKDEEVILAYLEDNNLVAEKHSSGLYYIMHSPGIGSHPNISSLITIDYVGYFTDGSVFDEGQLTDYPLGGLIYGWQYGIPLMRLGGEATLIVPSRLGYGSYGSGSVPGNTVILFDVKLLDFK
jgi:FKBP-type peptidyl-prolyl cis-trans isomerase FkpA